MNQWELTAAIAEAQHDGSIFLRLSGEGLESLPPEIGNLTGLEDLYLDDNQLTELPREIGNLTHLKALILRSNQLTSLPSEISNLTHLEWLSVSNNQLTELPPEICNLTRSVYEVFSKDKESNWSVNMRRLSDGETVEVNSRAIVTLFKKVPRPKTESDGQNHEGSERTAPRKQEERRPMDDDKVEAGDLIEGDQIWGDGLRILNLATNQLTALSPKIIDLITLEWLNLDGNQLTELPPEMWRLTSLKGLSVRANQLTAVPPEIRNLTHLMQLYLDDNKLTELPAEIGDLSDLFRVGLDGNQLKELPIEIQGRFHHGTRASVLTPRNAQPGRPRRAYFR